LFGVEYLEAAVSGSGREVGEGLGGVPVEGSEGANGKERVLKLKEEVLRGNGCS